MVLKYVLYEVVFRSKFGFSASPKIEHGKSKIDMKPKKQQLESRRYEYFSMNMGHLTTPHHTPHSFTPP